MDRATYVMAASVPKGNRIKSFWGEPGTDASDLLRNPPKFRWAGFDVTTGDIPRPGPDVSIEAGGPRKLIRLYQDGTLIVRVAADGEFLGWGRGEFSKFPRFNPVAVVEIHTSFVYLLRNVLHRLTDKPSEVTIRLSLSPGEGAGMPFLTQHVDLDHVDRNVLTKYILQERPANAVLELDGDEIMKQPNRAAFRVLRQFVEFFDMPEDQIPFTQVADGVREVDLEAIKELRVR